MPYAGKSLIPRQLAADCHKNWQYYELTKAIGVALGESKGSVGAWHDNINSEGKVSSRDCGIFQINIPGRDIDTAVEYSLRTDSMDEEIYRPVVEYNISRALALYNSPWIRDGEQSTRRWQPWVAYTTGWVTFPEFWVWRQENKVPVGPWVPTGRYIHKAIVGQMNYHVAILKDWSIQKALKRANSYKEYFGITQGKLGEKKGLVAWIEVPQAPSAPPADGIGPRPVPNDGL